MDPLDIWPVLGLAIDTPRLQLRPAWGDLMFELAELAAQGIHDPASMPFLVPWTDAEPDELRRESVRHFCSTWSAFRPEAWNLPFAVHEDGQLVGLQAVHNPTDFRITRSFETGSWLGRAHQGRGIGTEMRAAVLHLMFDALGAEHAHTGAWEDNPASLGVTRSLGYEDNGQRVLVRRGAPAGERLFRLSRAAWLERRRPDITVHGVDERFLAFIGLRPDLTPMPDPTPGGPARRDPTA